MPKRTIFLCGPMRGIPRHEGIEWREKAVKMLEQDFQVLHAYRGREEKETFPDPRGAIIRDKQDIERSDILIVNDTFENASMIGTAMEVFIAHSKGKVVILFGDAHKADYWLNAHAHMRVSALEEACAIAVELFSQ